MINTKIFSLSGNQLKIIAAILMTIDHIGAYLFPNDIVFRIIGRLSFPVFAYMIVEGCKFTRNRKRYFLNMSSSAFLCQLVYFLALNSLKQCILVTFSLSVLLIYVFDRVALKKDLKNILIMIFSIIAVFFISEIVPMLSKTDFYIDYGFSGILVPVFVSLGKTPKEKLKLLFSSLILLCFSIGGIQWFSLFSILFISLYSGERGKKKMKSFFYIYYPLHLIAIYLISFTI